jgi:hypothetical protein
MSDSVAGSSGVETARPDAVLEADGVRVAFVRQRDRYAHRVDVFDATAGGWRTELESVEGTADDVWPAGPPLQHLHVEQRTEGPVALLVGMAGRTHWSAAVEVVRGALDGAKVIRFDIAARLPAAPGAGQGGGPSGGPSGAAEPWLGTTYRRLTSEGRERLLVRPLDGAEHVGADSLGDACFVIRPSGLALEGSAVARTIAWRYEIEPSRK